MKKGICSLTAWGLMTLVLMVVGARAQDAPPPQPAATEVTIGIVTDGSTAEDKAIVSLFKQEVEAMMEGEAAVRFPKNMILSGHDSRRGVRRALDRLFSGAQPDVILALGVITSTEVLSRTHIPKPVVAPFVANFALKARLKKAGQAGIANFAYIDSMFYLDQDIETFRKIVAFKHVAFVFDRRDVRAFPNFPRLAKAFAARHKLKVSVIAADSSAAKVLKAIPAGVDAVMVGPLWHFTQAQKERLAKGLIGKKLPGFSIWESAQVKQGLLAGLETREKQDILARRAAVAVMDIVQGEKVAALDVAFVRNRKLTINMATARQLNIYPSLLVMTGADLINEERQDITRRLNIRKAVAEAVAANLGLQAAHTTVKAGRYSIDAAKADLLPRIDIETGARAIDQDRAKAGGGMSPERAWTGSAGGSVVLYSDQKWANYTAENHIQRAREMDLERVRLNVTQAAAVAYLNVLRAKTIERLYKENLKLTQANLERAQIKVSTGAAGPDEVYRWEAKFANDRRQVLRRESDTLDAMEALNRVLHRPLQELFVPEEAKLKDPLFVMSDKFFYRLMENPYYLRKFRDFAVNRALSLRPELKSFDAAIEAKKRLTTAARRAYWLPDFTVQWKVDQYFLQDGSGRRSSSLSGLDDTDWNVGLYARLPLFEGGKKNARVGRLREELTRLQINKGAEAEIITQNVLAALNRTRASYPSISLTRDAAKAARQNLELVTSSYVEGIKTIIDLLDAQNNSLSADLDAANAVYDFLIDLMGVERSIGEFVTFMPLPKRQAWYQEARSAIGMK